MDLKIGEFKPEYAGKMNYYLSLLHRLERREDENRSIGIILCAEKDNVEVELALEDMGKPIGVADYQQLIRPWVREPSPDPPDCARTWAS